MDSFSDVDLRALFNGYVGGDVSSDGVLSVLVDYVGGVDDLQDFYNMIDDFFRGLGSSFNAPLSHLLSNGLFDKYIRPLGESRDLFEAYVVREDRDLPWWLSTFGTFRIECCEAIAGGAGLEELMVFLNHYSSVDDSVPYDRFFNITGFDANVYDRVVFEFAVHGVAIGDNVRFDDVLGSLYYYLFVMRDYWSRMVELRRLIFTFGLLNDCFSEASGLGFLDGEGGMNVKASFYEGLPGEYRLGVIV